MLGTHNLILFITSGLLLNITPGADSLYIVSRSLTQGRRAGVAAAFGIVQMIYSGRDRTSPRRYSRKRNR